MSLVPRALNKHCLSQNPSTNVAVLYRSFASCASISPHTSFPSETHEHTFWRTLSFVVFRRACGFDVLARVLCCSGYQFKVGSYIQVNCPAISAKEWHPFSMFPVPGPRPRGGFYVEAVRTYVRSGTILKRPHKEVGQLLTS